MGLTTRRGGAHVRRDSDPITDDRIDDRTDDRTLRGTEPVVGTRERFGGLDVPAAFAGTMAALGMLALLGAIASAWINAYNADLTRSDVVSPAGLVVGLVIVVAASLFGGWVAGRTGRYTGAGNGLLTGLLLILATAGIGWLVGSQAQDGTDFRMPSWITNDATSNAALVAAGVAALIALLCTTLGGSLGSFWHRRVDRSLVTETEQSAFAPYPEDQRLVRAPKVDENPDDMADEEPVTTPATTRSTSARGGRKRTTE